MERSVSEDVKEANRGKERDPVEGQPKRQELLTAVHVFCLFLVEAPILVLAALLNIGKKLEDEMSNTLKNRLKWILNCFPAFLLVLGIIATAYPPFAFPFLFLCMLLVTYPLLATKRGRFNGILQYWRGLTIVLVITFFVTVYCAPLCLFLAASPGTLWGIATCIFLHASVAHLLSNLSYLSFLLYLMLACFQTPSNEAVSTYCTDPETAKLRPPNCSLVNENADHPNPAKPPTQAHVSDDRVKTLFVIVAPFVAAILANLFSLQEKSFIVGASALVFAVAGILLVESVKNVAAAVRSRQRGALLTNLLLLSYFTVGLLFFGTFFNVAANVNYAAHEWAFLLGAAAATGFALCGFLSKRPLAH